MISDFDSDSFLNRIDLERTLRCLTRSELTQEEVSFVVEKVSTADKCQSLNGKEKACFHRYSTR